MQSRPKVPPWGLGSSFEELGEGGRDKAILPCTEGKLLPPTRPLKGNVSDEHEDSQPNCKTDMTVKQFINH